MIWPLGWPLCPSHGHQAAALATAWAELREATHLLTRACGWGDGAGIRLSRAGADARAPLQRQEASSAPCRSQHTQEDRLRQERMQLWKWFTGGLGTHVDLQKPEGTARPLPMALDFLPASLAAAPQSTLLGPLTLPEAGGPGLAPPLSPLAICSLGDPSLFCGLIHVIYGEKGPTISSPAVTSFLGLQTPTFNCLLENPTQMSQR